MGYEISKMNKQIQNMTKLSHVKERKKPCVLYACR